MRGIVAPLVNILSLQLNNNLSPIFLAVKMQGTFVSTIVNSSSGNLAT